MGNTCSSSVQTFGEGATAHLVGQWGQTSTEERLRHGTCTCTGNSPVSPQPTAPDALPAVRAKVHLSEGTEASDRTSRCVGQLSKHDDCFCFHRGWRI